jgi:hypothetical protein
MVPGRVMPIKGVYRNIPKVGPCPSRVSDLCVSPRGTLSCVTVSSVLI